MVLDGLPRRAASRLDGETKNGVGRECASRGHPAPACVPPTWRTVKQPKWAARISQFAVPSVPLRPVSSAECWACVTTATCALPASAQYYPCIVTFFSGNRLHARATRALPTPPSHSTATHSNPHNNSVFALSAARPGLDTLPLQSPVSISSIVPELPSRDRAAVWRAPRPLRRLAFPQTACAIDVTGDEWSRLQPNAPSAHHQPGRPHL